MKKLTIVDKIKAFDIPDDEKDILLEGVLRIVTVCTGLYSKEKRNLYPMLETMMREQIDMNKANPMEGVATAILTLETIMELHKKRSAKS